MSYTRERRSRPRSASAAVANMSRLLDVPSSALLVMREVSVSTALPPTHACVVWPSLALPASSALVMWSNMAMDNKELVTDALVVQAV